MASDTSVRKKEEKLATSFECNLAKLIWQVVACGLIDMAHDNVDDLV